MHIREKYDAAACACSHPFVAVALCVSPRVAAGISTSFCGRCPCTDDAGEEFRSGWHVVGRLNTPSIRFALSPCRALGTAFAVAKVCRRRADLLNNARKCAIGHFRASAACDDGAPTACQPRDGLCVPETQPAVHTSAFYCILNAPDSSAAEELPASRRGIAPPLCWN